MDDLVSMVSRLPLGAYIYRGKGFWRVYIQNTQSHWQKISVRSYSLYHALDRFYEKYDKEQHRGEL